MFYCNEIVMLLSGGVLKMKTVIFIKVRQGIRELERNLGHKYGDDDLSNYKLEALNQIKSYIEGCALTNKRVRAYLHCNCSCTVAAKELNIKQTTMQVYITRSSESLEKEVGSDVVDAVLGAESAEGVDAVMIQTRQSIKKQTKPDCFIKEVYEMLPKAKYSSDISIKDCKTELIILSNLSRVGLSKLINKGDPGKIAYILSILESDSVYDVGLRNVIYRALEPNLT